MLVLIVTTGTTAGALLAMAPSGTRDPHDDRPSPSGMTPEERIKAMDMRTLPNGRAIGHKPVAVDWTIDDVPDFIAAKYGGGKVGYIRRTDAFQPPPETKEDLVQKLREGPRIVPVFADDGQTVIGERKSGAVLPSQN